MWEPFRRSAARIWSTIRRSRREEELQAEIEFHLQTLADEYRRRGMSDKEARLAAKREFGGAEQMKEIYRERRGFPLLESIWQDMKLAFRGLRKSPAFTVVAIASLALGIGANTAIFSFVNAVLLKQLPVPEPERLVTFALFENGKETDSVFRLRPLDELAERSNVFDGLFGRFPKAASFSVGDKAQWVMAELVTGQYFRALKTAPAIGRLLTEEDVRNAAGDPVCVLSYDMWQKNFGGDPKIVGRAVSINNRPYRVLGVTERGFYGPELQQRMDLQVPATRMADFMPAFGNAKGFDWKTGLTWLLPMGRLKPNLTRSEAESQLQRLYQQIRPESGHKVLRLAESKDGFNNMRGNFGKPVSVLMAVVALVLLIACANLANLLLARASAREKEFAVRLSLGASRIRLIRQLLIESLLLAFCGGALGVLFSFWIISTLLAFLNEGRSAIYALHVSPDLTVLWFAIALSFMTAVLFGLAPAWQATQPDLIPSLKEAGGSLRPGDRTSLRKFLVVAQVGLSLVVLFAAGLLTRTLRSLQTVNLGFQREKVIALSIDTDVSGYPSAQASQIQDEILRRLRLFPGVQAASLVVFAPFSGNAMTMGVEVPGFTAKNPDELHVVFNTISPGYFNTLNQPRLLGRDFSDSDTQKTQKVAIVNEKFVQHYFAGRSPLGQHINSEEKNDLEIVGVVANARDMNLRQQPTDTVYLPEKQTYNAGLTLLLRTQIDLPKLTPSLYALVRNVDKKAAISSIRTLDSQIDAGLSSERILSYLSSLFAGLATLLTGIGLYGVIAYGVTRRTREIGVRFVLGAQGIDVAKLFLRESLVVIAVGLIVGIPLALASVTALKSLLFGLTATDLPTLLMSVVLLIVAGLVATALPLKQAVYVDPQ